MRRRQSRLRCNRRCARPALESANRPALVASRRQLPQLGVMAEGAIARVQPAAHVRQEFAHVPDDQRGSGITGTAWTQCEIDMVSTVKSIGTGTGQRRRVLLTPVRSVPV